MKPFSRHALASIVVAFTTVVMIGCSGSGTTSTGGGGGGGSTSNVQTMTINAGPAGGYVDGAFTSVTVCVPGSTTNCQTVDGILVDTGSSGLRMLSSALTITPTQQKDSSGDAIGECVPFVDGFTWGAVQTVDMTIAGEEAKSLPIQVINSNFSSIPNSCSSNGSPENDLADLGANGILGVGNFPEDCGGGCTENGGANPGLYYACPGQTCTVTTESIADQVQNPVVLFATDNNGVVIKLEAVTGAEASVSGSLIFGIGTQSNNALGSATVYTVDPSDGNFSTTFKGVLYDDESFLDTGSNGLYFLDSNTTGMPTCNDLPFLYCPTTTQSFSATNQAYPSGATGSINFVVGNGDTLTANQNDAAINGLGGPGSSTPSFPIAFDWGLPFYFGRTVYTAIYGQNTPAGAGPYVAY
ncbi:MAG: DUF3443 domain-containing protein [Candidatus Acidiferrum sp.]